MSSQFRKCCSCVPQRWIVSAMGFFAFFNAYTLRICLSIAITQMAVPLNNTEESVDETCPDYDYENHVSKNTTAIRGGAGTFEWSEYTQGIILSSFYWGYVITHLPGGLLAERYGPKSTMGIALLVTAILTILTPVATKWGDANALIVVRFLMGLGEGVIQPAMSCLLAQWIPPRERSTTGALVYMGIRFGMLISTVTSGLIMSRSSDDWPFIFYLFGGIGVLWYLFWLLLCYNNPRDHPFITEKETLYLREQIGSFTHEKIPPFPWRHALTSKPFWALIIMQSGMDWNNYTIMSDLPKYMNNVLKLPVQLNGYASSLHLMTSWIFCLIMSWLSDWLSVKEYMSRTNIRKLNTTVSSMGPAIMLVLATYMGCNVIAAVSFITIGLTLTGSNVPGIKVNVLDLSPNYAGTLMGISNGIGAFMGILAPYSVGVLAPNQTLSEWRLIFWIGAAVYIVTTLNFIVFASGDIQEWNDPAFITNKQMKGEDLEEDNNLLAANRIRKPN